MNYKRALGFAAVMYVASFLVGLLVVALGTTALLPVTSPIIFYVVQFASVAAIGVVFGRWYFRSPTTTPSAQNGFFFGLIAIGIAFLLDLILAVPAVLLGMPFNEFIVLYADPLFWATVLLLIAATTYAGFSMRRAPAIPQHTSDTTA